MRSRAWYDQCREHEPLPPELWGACPQCGGRPRACIPDYYQWLESWSPFPSDRETRRGSDEERAFFAAIAANVLEATPRLVFADWLDEHGRTAEGAALRDRWGSPVITPFRVLPYWRKAPLFARLLRQEAGSPEAAIVARRLRLHDDSHGGGVRAKGMGCFARVLLLDDEEAVLCGIARWPLLPREAEPIIRTRCG